MHGGSEYKKLRGGQGQAWESRKREIGSGLSQDPGEQMEDRAVYSDIPWKLKDKEKRLISFIRQLGHGELIIKVQDGLPVMIEKSTEKVKL